MRIYLIRHGQTAWNVVERAQGHTDIPLDETGLEQAQRLGERFRDLAVDVVWSSDLQRCRQIAAPLLEATGARLEVFPELRERNYGDWEGASFLDIARFSDELTHHGALGRHEITPPNGESLIDVWNRASFLAERLRDETHNIAVVTHGGTLSVILAQLIEAKIESVRSFRFSNTSVTELERRPEGTLLLTRYSDGSHVGLDRPPPDPVQRLLK